MRVSFLDGVVMECRFGLLLVVLLKKCPCEQQRTPPGRRVLGWAELDGPCFLTGYREPPPFYFDWLGVFVSCPPLNLRKKDQL